MGKRYATMGNPNATFNEQRRLMRQEISTPLGRAIGRPAGFWIRVGAYLVDGIIFLMVQWILWLAAGMDAYYADLIAKQVANRYFEPLPMGPYIVFVVYIHVLWWLYISIFLSSRLQATPGKLVAGI